MRKIVTYFAEKPYSWYLGILMPKLHILILSLLITYNSLLITPVFARTTPEDIANQRKEEYNAKIKNYSPESKQKLEQFSQKIADLNKSQSDILEAIMLRQGQILDEYILRNKIELPVETDGIHRRDNPVEETRYWVTYAHEAVAYQAAHIYIVGVTGENNIDRDIINTISALQSDMGVLKGKVIKSQKVLEELVSK